MDYRNNEDVLKYISITWFSTGVKSNVPSETLVTPELERQGRFDDCGVKAKNSNDYAGL